MLPLITIVVAAALAQSTPAIANVSTAGARVPDFSLDDIHRRPRSLESFKDKKAFVVLFVDTECPLANLYVPTQIELHRKYAPRGVQFLAINSSRQDSFVQVSATPRSAKFRSPCSKTSTRKLPTPGAPATPEAFLLDADRVIRYHGRIDDQYGIGFRRDKPAAQRPRPGPRRVLGRKTDHDPAYGNSRLSRSSVPANPRFAKRSPSPKMSRPSFKSAVRNATDRAKSARFRC